MGKKLRSKSDKAFRFQTFSERISSINIDVIHQIRHHDDTPEDINTYFWESLRKHSELNCTEHFASFRGEISDKVRTITQLVHHKDTIITAIKKHLLVPDSMALPALMDLVVALARDLQRDLYPYFCDFFDILVKLLGTFSQDVEILEQTFTCLSYLFKFLWRYLIKDIEKVYGYFSSLLSHRYKQYIRNFAAESFAFLMRKVKDHSGLFDFLLETLKDHPEKSEGLGQLLFEMMKGVKGQFHSSTTRIFPILLQKLCSENDPSDDLFPWQHIETTFHVMLVSMMKHADMENFKPMVDSVLESMTTQYQQLVSVKGKKKKAGLEEAFARFLRLGKCLLDYKSGMVIAKPDMLAKMLIEFLQGKNLPDCVGEPLLALSSSLLIKCSTKLEVLVTSRLVSSVFKSAFPLEEVYTFVRCLFKLPIFEKDVLPYLMPYLDQHITMDTKSHDLTLLLVTELILQKSHLPHTGYDLENTETYMLDFGVRSKFPDVITSLIDEIKQKNDRSTLIKFWIALICAPHVRPFRKDGITQIMTDFIVDSMSGSENLDRETCFVMTQVIVSMVTMEDDIDFFSQIVADHVFYRLLTQSQTVHYLRFVDMYLSHAVRLKINHITTEDNFQKIFPVLQENLSSSSSLVRMFTLRILTNFNLNQPESEVEVVDVLKICLHAEMVPATVHTYRDKLRHLHKLEHDDIQKSIHSDTLKEVPLRYLIGSLYVNFKFLWLPIIELISSHANGMDKTVFWSVLGKHLTLAAENCRMQVPEKAAGDPETDEDSDDLSEVFVTHLEEVMEDPHKPDFSNFRIQLWRAMQKFPEKCESKSRVFVPLFFDFLKLEYYTADMGLAPSQNILRSSLDNAAETSDKEQKITSDVNNQTKNDNKSECIDDTDQVDKANLSVINKSKSTELSQTPRYRTRSISKSEDVNMEEESEDSVKTSSDDTKDKNISVSKKSKSHRPFTRSHGKVEDMEEESSDDDDDDDDELADDNEPSDEYPTGREVDTDNELEANESQNSKLGESVTSEKDSTSRDKLKKAVTGTLLIHLELFAKLKNSKSIHRESELKELYFEFLLHKNPQVQKVAFTCLANYKDKYLIPYRENFDRLLDDKTFKNELVCFSIDDENSVIDTLHRTEVMPILMRILHGKMHSKAAGQRGMGTRQSIILRFLTGSRQDELKIFIDLIFKAFLNFVSDNLLEKVKEIRTGIDFTNVVTIKKAQGVMGSIELILKKLGHKIDSYLPDMIQIMVGLGTTSSVCLDNRHQIVPFVINPLKGIRQTAMSRITQIFVEYDGYRWTPIEIDGIFEGLIWPQLAKMSVDAFDKPNPTLRYFLALTQNHRYFRLLAKHRDGDITCTPLVHVIKLLSHKDVSNSVTSVVMEMINNLLSDPDDQEEDLPQLQVNHMLKIDQEFPIGVALLKPHVNDILFFLDKKMKTLFTRMNKKQENFVELDILSKISCFVTDADLCKTSITLLLPFLHKKRSQKAEEDILHSIENMMKLVDDRSIFIPTVCRLFATLAQRNSRILLSEVFLMMCEGRTELQNLPEIIIQLNSFDSQRLDEPDYLKRLEGYKAACVLINSMTKINRNICVVLINNCCYIINTTEDMSLRDASSNCLVTMVKKFGELQQDDHAYKTIIVEILLKGLKSGLHNRLEVVRHEYVVVLASLIDTFGTIQPFAELKILRDTDVEADFYENIKHIQMHKRSRGMHRLMKHLNKNGMGFNILMTYFVPLVTSFLTDHYRKFNALQDAAITCFGVICKQLPWKHYYHYLEHYIQLLGKRPNSQRLIVRVIVSILDAFHFDLANSTFDMKLAPDASTEVQEDKAVTSKDTQTEIEEIPEVVIPGDSDDEDRELPALNELAAVNPKWGKRWVQVCPEKMATKIHSVISKRVIFQLRKILVQKVESDDHHKVNKSKYAEDDEILRVPIALAMVKLMQHFPSGTLERFLPGVLLRVCNFLKSKSIEIRSTARDTLIKIQKSLGTRYFPFLLSELRGCLTLGYQRHVLCFTIHKLLVHMADSIQPGDIDVCLKSLQAVFNEEIFGDLSDEKDVKGITVKLVEAKSSKSFDSYKLIAAHVTKDALMELIQPLKEVLDTTHSSKVTNKVQTVLKTVVLGLVNNKHLNLEHLLVFVHGLISQTLPMLKENKDPKEQQLKTENLLEKKPDHSLLLPTETPRGGFKPKASKKTNLHVLVEFGLELLNSCKKKEKINTHQTEHLEMLDPLIPLISDCLFSKFARVNAFTLRNLCWMLKLDSPALKKNISKVADGMFILLRSHASSGTSKGDNVELLSMLFKAVTVLVKKVKYYNITSERLVVLLTFCEEDLYDYSRCGTAFTLLKAIMSRKVSLKQIDDIVKKVEELSITADAPHIRRECRQVVIQFLLDFPLGKKLQKHIEFYISQLSYEMESGRESALEMMATFFTSFPQNVLSDNASLFFIPMSANLVNDESAKCRKLTGLALKSLLTNIDHNVRTNLFSFLMKWFDHTQLKNRSLASQLCGLFVEVEGQKFEGRLPELLPILEQQLEPGKYEKASSDSKELDQDHTIYNTLNTLLKILRECHFLLIDKTWTSTMNILWEYVHHYLTYPHLWIQLVSCQLFGVLFGTTQPEQIFSWEGTDEPPYLMSDSLKKLQKLAMDFTTQLQSELLNEELANQVVKNMVFLGKCAKQVYTETNEDISKDEEVEDEETVEEETNKIFTLPWLVRKMVREAHYEALHNKRVILKRSSVFKWIAAVSLDLGEKILAKVLRIMLPPLQREIEDGSTAQNPALKNLAQEVLDLLKKTVGVEIFSQLFVSTQKQRADRKEERKQKRKVQAINDPEIAARRKIKKHLAKRDAKKRKIEEKRPTKQSKKRRYEQFNMD